MALDQVGEEGHQVAVEVCHVGARAHEAEDCRGAVGTFEEVPFAAANGWRGIGGRARGGDGASAAESAKPDHDFVLV